MVRVDAHLMTSSSRRLKIVLGKETIPTDRIVGLAMGKEIKVSLVSTHLQNLVAIIKIMIHSLMEGGRSNNGEWMVKKPRRVEKEKNKR